MDNKEVVLIGFSYTNLLGLVRSLGEAGIPIILLIVDDNDNACVLKGKYLKNQTINRCMSMSDVLKCLLELKNTPSLKYILCSGDKEAEFIDTHEKELSQFYVTPMRGKQIGEYFNKKRQYELAEQVGLMVPNTFILNRSEDVELMNLRYPVITKPYRSSKGCKSDIHICYSQYDLSNVITKTCGCNTYIIQEFIDEDFELDTLGVRTEKGIVWGGAVRKYRHNPWIVEAGAFAQLYSVETYNIPKAEVELLLDRIGYFGLFSVEFLHKNGMNYFMEVNFRNDRSGHVATSAGRNLPDIYLNGFSNCCSYNIKSVRMMNVWLDFLLVHEGRLSIFKWVKDVFRTESFIDYDQKDKEPFFYCIFSRFFQNY